jgi:uncharacterized protein YlxP (DUF503 family)
MPRARRAPEDRVHVGVLRLVLTVPGARTLKDRRQTLLSLGDRLRHRFPVTWSEIGTGDDPTRQTVVLTTASNDARLVRSILDQCVATVHGHPVAVAAEVDLDVFQWHSSREGWAARMMAELGTSEE